MYSENDSFMDGSSIGMQDSLASSMTGDRKVAPEINYKLTMAYEKTLSKEKCGLCKMFFHRDSINYKVPMHRILDIQKKWKLHEESSLEGRRYQNPSYLYTSTLVCMFCSQFFWLTDEEYQTKSLSSSKKIPSSEKSKIEITTVLERTNVAELQRAYQSSEVDRKAAALAITPPYTQASKTRREVDPWWEIEFGRRINLKSISFDTIIGIRQSYDLYIFLLEKPIGFENPFLDTLKSSSAKCFSIRLKPANKQRNEHIFWELPPRTNCFAIRIQLEGIYSLSIQRFVALQGDDIVFTSEEEKILASNSFASLDPRVINESLKEMRAQEEEESLMKRPPTAAKKSPIKSYNILKIDQMSMDAVRQLSRKINVRYNTIESWKSQTLEYIKMFPELEINLLYRIIFKYTADLYPLNGDRVLDEFALLEHALTQHFPRCDLQELHQRIRAVLRWIQTRTHMKVLGDLLNSEPLNVIANNPDDHLYKLSTAFKKVEQYWNKKQAMENTNKLNSGLIESKVSELRGCSWSQFLQIICLLCRQECHLIPSLVYNLGNNTTNPLGSINIPSLSTSQPEDQGSILSMDSKSISVAANTPKGSRRQSTKIVRQRSSPRTITSVVNKSNNSFDEDDLFEAPGDDQNMSASLDQKSWITGSISSPSMQDFKLSQFSISRDETSLRYAVRKEGFVPFDSSFAEYKFDHFKKKLRNDQVFPKYLSLDFARTLIPIRPSTSMTVSSSLTLENTLSDILEEQGVEEESHASDFSSANMEYNGVPLPKPSLMRGNTMRLMRGNTHANLSALLEPGKSFRSSETIDENHKLPPPLVKTLTMRPSTSSLISASASSANMKAMLSSSSIKSAPSSPAKQVSAPPTSLSKKQKEFDFDDMDFDFDDESHHSNHKEIKNIDFFRVCALCELRLPRESVHIKVLRKHIVKLRGSWDTKLVSKEVRSLDNTISMYSLVNVCLFCAQFFDPDFPDGIAYPVKVAPKLIDTDNPVTKAILTQKQDKKMLPYYDIRYAALDIDVGQVFRRPETSESRHRARRAKDIADRIEQKALQYELDHQKNQ